jgi:hypothetical protein
MVIAWITIVRASNLFIRPQANHMPNHMIGSETNALLCILIAAWSNYAHSHRCSAALNFPCLFCSKEGIFL